jgi:transposase-like protein
MQNLREIRGKLIAEKPNQIVRQDERFYRVASQSGNGMYTVIKARMNRTIGWVCDCPDWTYRQVKCKHIWAVEFSLALRKVVEPTVIEPLTIEACVYCRSQNLTKWGIRHNKYGDIQKFSCKACGKFFTVNIGFERMKHNPQGITTAMQLYFSGESLRSVSKSLRLLGVEVSHQTVYNWIAKYTQLMKKYVDKITPQISDTWRADELFLKVHGDMKYLYAMMDNDTRFWIAQQVADTKGTADITPLFRQGKKIAGKAPHTVITDGAFNFHTALKSAYWRENKALAIQHVRHVRMSGDVNNNQMERFNGELRDREKVTRNLKKPDTPILSGMQIFHNYVRPHMALDGRTPSEAAGIQVKGENKWLTLIQNAQARNSNDAQSAHHDSSATTR